LQRIEIDGSLGEGGGQILRTALSLAAIYRKSVRIYNIRAGRQQPGLRPQHLQAVLAVSKISGGSVRGANIGSTEIEFSSEKSLPKSYTGILDTGTAGSITLIAQTVVPISIFGHVDLSVEIRGGTEVPNSPTIDYLSELVVPVYRKLGANLELKLKRRGYYPEGGGSVTLNCSRVFDPLPIDFTPQEKLFTNILSASRLLPPHVVARQAERAEKILKVQNVKIGNVVTDTEGDSLSPGSSILVYRRGDSTFVGASSLGERGKKAEVVGEEASRNFLNGTKFVPSVDPHMADMLVTLLSCVPGKSVFKTSILTDHFLTNCEIAKRLIDCEIRTEKTEELWHVEVVGSPEKPN